MFDFGSDEFFMEKALQEAMRAYDQNEVPIGAVVVKDQKIIGRGYNQVESLRDATAHAEIIAITSAANTLDNWRLEGCTLFVTLEPCPMCAGAILNSRLSRVVFGAKDDRLGACETHFHILQKNPIQREIEEVSGPLAEECLWVIKDFFAKKRAENKKRPRLSQGQTRH